jgi:hypothetical protein
METKFKIEIPKWTNKNINGNNVTYFNFVLDTGNEVQKFEKRFSECHILYEDLKKSHGSNIPPFPPKSIFTLKTYEQLNPRRQKLEFFFQNIIKRMDLLRDKEVVKFLKIQLSQEDGFTNLVKMIAKMNCTFGVRDFIFDIGRNY